MTRPSLTCKRSPPQKTCSPQLFSVSSIQTPQPRASFPTSPLLPSASCSRQISSTSGWMSWNSRSKTREFSLTAAPFWDTPSPGHSVPPECSTINIASDDGLANDHELDFGLGSDLIQVHNNSSRKITSTDSIPFVQLTYLLPRASFLSALTETPSSTSGPQVSTSTHNQNPLSAQQEDLPLDRRLAMLPETSKAPLHSEGTYHYIF